MVRRGIVAGVERSAEITINYFIRGSKNGLGLMSENIEITYCAE
jgi:hypothetical protein